MKGLVISRRPNESFHIGTAVVTVVEIDGRVCKLNIVAPADTKILRSELIERDRLKAETEI